MHRYINWFETLSLKDINLVGGKNASLGELINNMVQLGINVPNGFALNTNAWDEFIKYNNLDDKIKHQINSTNILDIKQLEQCGSIIRNLILSSTIPDSIIREITNAYTQLSNNYKIDNVDVAVRSSSTAEDLPEASFAGQQDTYLNITGIENILVHIKNCYASLFNDRAISYRHHHNYPLNKTKLAVSIQKMVRSDLGSAGVAFSLDTESGNQNIILINGSYGLGELVVGGAVIPDEFILSKRGLNNNKYPILNKILGNKNIKMIYNNNNNNNGTIDILTSQHEQDSFCLDENNIIKLGKWLISLENHYKCPIDVEWAFDGLDNNLYIVQVRPETVHSKKNNNVILEYKINKKINNKLILTGIAVGQKIASGNVSILDNPSEDFTPGNILVTDITTPDWEPIMRIANGIITNKGGKTAHAAIVARELGIPAIVGTNNATETLNSYNNSNNSDKVITISCAEGEVGNIYDGEINYEVIKHDLGAIKIPKSKIMLNVGSPEGVFKYSDYPSQGVGLTRIEFIFNNFISIHPLALLKHQELNDVELTTIIKDKIKNYTNEIDYFIKKLSYGIGLIASTFYPNDVIVRFSDFKSNEYVNLVGGKYFEPNEENPMIGYRGACRYYSKDYIDAFKLECQSIKFIRDNMGWTNVIPMIPFCRTVTELVKVSEIMTECGLVRGHNDLQVYMMCEIPSNVIYAEGFAPYLDGVSIGGNDLLQLTLGLDRDSGDIAHVASHTDVAYRRIVQSAINNYHKCGVKVGFCGQQPSDSTEFAEFLVKNNIDTISVTPDSLFNVINTINKIEQSK